MALAAGIAVALLGLVIPALRWLYDYAWFVGFVVAGAIYLALMHREPVTALGEIMNVLPLSVCDRASCGRAGITPLTGWPMRISSQS